MSTQDEIMERVRKVNSLVEVGRQDVVEHPDDTYTKEDMLAVINMCTTLLKIISLLVTGKKEIDEVKDGKELAES